jgi:hypothetical protein
MYKLKRRPHTWLKALQSCVVNTAAGLIHALFAKTNSMLRYMCVNMIHGWHTLRSILSKGFYESYEALWKRDCVVWSADRLILRRGPSHDARGSVSGFRCASGQ